MSQVFQPQYIESLPNQTVEVQGNLSQGAIMEDLSWAWSSSNACFPATEQEHFQGAHVLYYTDLPRYSEMEITVIPDSPGDDMSLYAYEVGQVSEGNTVPRLPSCVRCEADHKWSRPRVGKTQTHTRTVRDILAINNPYQVVIGVVGANGLQDGGFTLQISMKKR